MTSLPTTPASNDAAALNLEEMPITQHLVVLRKHLFKVVAVLIGLFFCLLPFANQTYQWLSEPLRAQLPASSTMIATDVTATFMAGSALPTLWPYLRSCIFLSVSRRKLWHR